MGSKFSFCTLIFSFIFFVQSSTWASAQLSLYSQNTLTRMVKQYHSLSNEEKQKLIFQAVQNRPKIDQVYWKENIDLKNITLPGVGLIQNKLMVNLHHKKISVVFESPYLIRVNGKLIDLSPGRMKEAALELERILSDNRTGFLDILIPSAHAWVALGLAGFIAILVIMPVIGTIDKNAKDEEWMKDLSLKCETGNSRYEALSHQGRSEEKQKLFQLVSEWLKKIEEDPHCGYKGDYLEREWEKPKCDHYARTKSCLEAIQNKLGDSVGFINQNESREVKEDSKSNKSSGVSSSKQ